MKASVGVNVRIPVEQYRLIRRVARANGKAIAAYVREAAVKRAETENHFRALKEVANG